MSKQRLFRFKKFYINHSRATMKVGTDGVLVGAWANMNQAKRILDIGTGSGVIALMMAQRSADDTVIDAVEVEKMDAEQAHENVLASPWPQKIVVHNISIQNFFPGVQYELIITNPPFFSKSFSPPDKRRLEARHTGLLNFDELVLCVQRLLTPEGNFNLILPPVEGEIFSELMMKAGFFCTRRWVFRTRAEKPPERLLMEFSRTTRSCDSGEILLYQDGENWSDSYRGLTYDFYLNA
jgi:tRNA1Val (adenine37-N6)-methyltransferase